MLKLFTWVAVSVASMLGTFYIIYAMYCHLYGVDPQDIWLVFRTCIDSNVIPTLEIPKIPDIGFIEVGGLGGNDVFAVLASIGNFFIGLVNTFVGLINFIVSVLNAVFAVLKFVVVLILMVFNQALGAVA